MYQPLERRIQAWDRLAADLDVGKLASITEVVSLDDVFDVAERILQGQVRGRVVVDVNA